MMWLKFIVKDHHDLRHGLNVLSKILTSRNYSFFLFIKMIKRKLKTTKKLLMIMKKLLKIITETLGIMKRKIMMIHQLQEEHQKEENHYFILNFFCFLF